MMRYLRYSRKNNFLTVFKKTACMIATVSVIAAVFVFFGEPLTESALFLTFGNMETYNVLTQEQNFEEDFSTFIEKPEPETTVTTNNEAIAVNLSALSGKYANYKGTSVINNTKYDVTKLLYADYEKPKLNNKDPYILIYHTHTSESYYGGGTVVDVGKTMVEEFEKLGYTAIHLTETYDKGQFSGAYSRSIKGVEEILKKYPTIKLVFDVHRDSITAANGDTYCPLTLIDGKNCAQVMFVCGTDEKGLKHPNWRQNFKFALDVSRTIGKTCGAMSRPVNLRGDRFNTHVTNHSFLIEMGSAANTVDEANLAAIHTARAIIETIE